MCLRVAQVDRRYGPAHMTPQTTPTKQPTWQALAPGIAACVFGAAITLLALVLPTAHNDDTHTPSASLATDPVCGMKVVVDDNTLHVDHNGVRHFFCAASCRDTFVAAPERYSAR
jgi:YHS domain-containing protein